jgi:hypothetical protein
MANVYIEPRPKGRPEGSPIDDFVVEDGAARVLKTFKTQKEAIEWAKRQGYHPLVARVRHLNDKKMPDHWRGTATAVGIEKDVATLPPDELAQFRAWFEQFDSARFDQKIERDAKEGRLDQLANEALDDLRNGRAREL